MARSVPRAATMGPDGVEQATGSEVQVPPREVNGPGLPDTKRRYQMARSNAFTNTNTPAGSLMAAGSELIEPPRDVNADQPPPALREYQSPSSAPRPNT